MFLVFFFDTFFTPLGRSSPQSLFVFIDCQALATLKKWWGFLQDLEKAMLYNQSLLDAWKFFYFPDQTWVRINLLRLSEVDFKKTPDRVTEAISNKVGCVMTCLANELGNGALRRREDHHSAGSMGHVEKWHQLSTSRVLTDHGRNEPVATQTAINYRPQGVPKTLFTSKDHENSLGATYDKLSAPNVDWMNLTWETSSEVFLRSQDFSQ